MCLSLPFVVTNSSDLAAWTWTRTSSRRGCLSLHSSCMFWCFPNLLSSLQHLIWNPNESLWQCSAVVWSSGRQLPLPLLQQQTSLNWLYLGQGIWYIDSFKACLLYQHVFVLPNSFKLIATSYMEPKWSLWAWSEGVEGHYLPFLRRRTATLNWLPWPVGLILRTSHIALPPSKRIYFSYMLIILAGIDYTILSSNWQY